MIHTIRVWGDIRSWLQRLPWLGSLLTRITIGDVFIESGWGKLHNVPKVVGYFTELGVPFPEMSAHLVAFTEFSCGTLILLGLFTRLASLPLISTMVVAILTAKKEDLHGFSDLTGFIEYLYIVLLVWLIIQGAGFLSVDAWLSKRASRRREPETTKTAA